MWRAWEAVRLPAQAQQPRTAGVAGAGRRRGRRGQSSSLLWPAESQVCPWTAPQFMLTRRPVYANEVGFQEASRCAAGHKDQTHPQLPGREALETGYKTHPHW